MKNFALMLLILVGLEAHTQPRDVYTTTSGGSWVNALNWDLGSSPNNNQTDGGDDIIITHHITLTDDLTVKSGTIISITGCDTLHVTGNVAFNNGSAILVEPCAVLIIDGNLANNNNSTDIQINGKIIISGNYDGGTGSELVGTGEMEIEGEVTTDGTSTIFGSEDDCTVDCDNSSSDPLGNDPLPIELVFFNAIQEDNTVRLEWLTASEINNDFFEIHKSIDGINWNLIGSISGAGNNSSPLMYNFIDNRPHNGHNYFKLFQVDYDGTTHEKKLVYINMTITDIVRDVAIYPNPVINEDVNIKLTGFIGEEVVIVVVDILGNVYYEKAAVTISNNQIVIINSDLVSGTYLVVGSTKQELYKRKLIIQ